MGRDENVWCIDVIVPLIKLAVSLEGADKFWLQSVYIMLCFFLNTHADF
jgi:hypothetical protein